MNVAVDPERLRSSPPLPGARRSRALRLGMPELCLTGLSETWLLKTLGDVHWRLIADLAGRDRPQFQDLDGSSVYAAFCAVLASSLTLDRFREHDDLEIASELRQVSRTRFASRHRISWNGDFSGEIELLSIFVRNGDAGGNRAIARVALAEFQDAPPVAIPSPIARLSDGMRRGTWDRHRGFRRNGSAPIGTAIFRPCPSQDFNGARLLYFASYQAFADRAEWELLNLPSDQLSTVSRDIFFHGNIEPGDRLSVTVRDLRQADGVVEYWMTLDAEDGRLLADVFTTRSIAPSPQAAKRSNPLASSR